jgi:hypothetical protein
MKKMKKIYSLLLFLFFHSYFCFSQQPNDNDDDQRIEVIKKAYVADELKLSPQEAEQFWPVYNNYQNEIRQARKENPNNELAYEKKVVEIKQRYQGSFKKVLGNNGQRLNKVYTTDRKFRDMMRNELQKRQKQRQQQNFQQRSNQQRQPPRNMHNGNGNGQNKKINKNNNNGGKPKAHHRF